MTDSDKWEAYRGSHEPEEHWELRKQFLARNDDGRFSENRLLCLSRAFANMEFLGCKYPLETMETIRELSMGIIEDYRSQKETRIQRTFVGASAAAEKKTKGQNRPRDNQSKVNLCDFVPSSPSQTVWPVQTKAMSEPSVLPFIPRISPNNVALQSVFQASRNRDNSFLSSKKASDRRDMDVDIFHPDDVNVVLKDDFEKITLIKPIAALEILSSCDSSVYTIVNSNALLQELRDFYVVEIVPENNPVTILTQSFSMCHKNDKHKYEFPPYTLDQGYSCKCDMTFGVIKAKNFIVHGEGNVKKDAKKDVAENALKLFKQIRPTILVKDIPRRRVERCEIVPNSGLPQDGSSQSKSANHMGNNSVAMKMMLKMGWKGGGLGVSEDGISEPIDSATQHTRLGLGNERSKDERFQNTVAEFLREAQESLYDADIEFSSEFTKDERKFIHSLAERYNFKSRSYGPDNNRHLIISRKVDPDQIFKEVMSAGGETSKYTIIMPDCLCG